MPAVLAVADLSAFLGEYEAARILVSDRRRVRLIVLVGASSFLLDLVVLARMLVVLLTWLRLLLIRVGSQGKRLHLNFYFAGFVEDRSPDFLRRAFIVDGDCRFSLILLLTFHYLNYLTS